jgi:transaldolase
MKSNPLLQLQQLGQSIWLDTLSRHLLTSGVLRRLIEEDGLRGVTSNPAIFEKAIDESHDYDEAIGALAREGKSAAEIYQALTVDDIQRAADLFRPVYDRLDGQDGFVSLEVSPHLADDTEGSIAEARRLWAAVDRPNVFIKIPATRAGLPAISQLIGEGININITLLFGLGRYREVAEAYLAGLESRAARNLPFDRVASVASFFLSRIDVLVDPMLEHLFIKYYLEMMQPGGSRADIARALQGQVAIASAKMAYQIYNGMFSSDRFRHLEARGARSQRVLWASTGTKNPAYSDVKYVEPLIGRETVNTMPLETLHAYRDHGLAAARLGEGVEEAGRILARLSELGIDLDAVTQQLEREGIEKFNQPYDRLMVMLEQKRAAAADQPRRAA